jgi:ribose transport system substrate-binding protein
MIYRTSIQLLAMGFACLLALGCGSSGGDTTATTDKPATTGAATTGSDAKPAGGDDSKPLEVAFVTNGASDFWTIAKKGTDKAQAELKNVTVDFKIPANATAAEQKDIVDGLLVKGVQGIAISPKDPKNQTDYLKDVGSKTLLITQDSDAPESGRKCYVGTDNKAAGKLAGAALMKALPNGGKVQVFVGSMDAENAKDRFEGLKEAVAGSKIQILGVVTDDVDKMKAKANVSDTLVKIPDIAGLVGLWSYNGPAIIGAVKDAGKVGKVKIVCFDEEADTLAGVKSGGIDATIVQQPFEFGYQAVKLMAAYIRGDKSVVPASGSIIVDAKTIDKSNVDDFAAKLKVLRA